MDKLNWPFSFRKTIQGVWTLLTNGYISGFFKGSIYQGRLKNLCIPGLNCYSCPGALASCPIGSLQAVLGSANFKVSFYLIGFFLIIGTIFGRLVCGFLCPFGLVQELLNKIPFSKKIKTFKYDRALRWFKYVIFLIFVILIPLFIVDAAGTGSPAFCKWICPAGTLGGGIPLILTNLQLQSIVGFLFQWKLAILIITIIVSIIIYRPFCKYICPLGAIYALFNKVSIYKYNYTKAQCINCHKCEDSCPMNINPRTETNHLECVRCGVCKNICPTNAITSAFIIEPKPKQTTKGSIKQT